MRYPDFFSAVAPLASTRTNTSRADRLRGVTVWAFHAIFDNHPIDVAHQKVAAARNHGCNVRFTEVPIGTHSCWYDAFEDYDLLDWLLRAER